MKLFGRYSIYEGEYFPSSVFFSIIKVNHKDTTKDVTIYRLELPIAFTMLTYLPTSFMPVYGKCRPVWAYRVAKQNGIKSTYLIKTWKLVDESKVFMCPIEDAQDSAVDLKRGQVRPAGSQ